MPNRVRTATQLFAQFPDNLTRLIRAIDGRDLIATMFGFMMGGAPNASCDSADTLHLGAWFDAGSRWIDTAAKRVWVCLDGTPLAARWQAMMYDGQAAGGSLAGTYPNPTIAATGATSGAYGDTTNYASLTINAAGQVTAAASHPLPAAGVTSVTPTAPAGLNTTGSTTTGAATVVINWDNVAAGTVFGRTAGTGTGAPGAFTLAAGDIPNLPASIITSGAFSTAQIPNLPASIITSGAFSTAQIPNLPASIITSGAFSTAQIPNLPASIITSGAFSTAQIPNLDASQITTGVFSTSQIPNLSAAFITSGLFTNSALFNLDCSILVSGTLNAARLPVGVPIAGNVAGFPQWIKTSIPYTLVNAAGSANTVTLAALPALGVMHGYLIRVTVAYTASAASPVLDIGYSSGAGGSPTSTTFYASGQSITAVPSTPTIGGPSVGNCQNPGAAWNVTATVRATAGNLNTLTGGNVYVWVLVSAAT